MIGAVSVSFAPHDGMRLNQPPETNRPLGFKGGLDLEKGEEKPLYELLAGDTQWRLILDLVRAIVSDRIKISALEKLLTEKGLISREELLEKYEELLRSTSDDVINDVLQEFGKGDSDY